MYQQIQQELIKKGFFDVNGILTKFVGTRVYEVMEYQGEFWIETSFEGDDEAKNRVLDHIQDLAPRYALTQAKVRGERLRIDLTRPSDDAVLEATRIDFLTQSLESGISPLEGVVERSVSAADSKTLRKDPGSSHAGPVTGGDDPLHEAHREGPSGEDDEDFEVETENYYDIKNDAEEDFEADERVSARQENNFRASRSHHTYIPLEENPYHGGVPKGVVTGLVDRSFSLTGFTGAVLGATLGAMIMSGVRVLDAPSQLVGFLIPFLIIGIYRVMAGHQMSISLGVFLVLGSLFMGSVLTSAIELLQQTDLGLRSALWEGLAAHYNNDKYYVRTVWVQYGLSVLAASVPTMLLLAGGKRKIQYSK